MLRGRELVCVRAGKTRRVARGTCGHVTYRCAIAAEERAEPVQGTAVVTDRWLLVEEPGPWGADGLTESRIASPVARTLAARARDHGVRVQLIRRYADRRGRTNARAWALADSRPGREAIRWGTFDTDDDLLDIPLDQPVPTGDDPADDTTYFVCTHGRRDACCALRGRPVVALLAAHRPERTWEISHLGGHRFAATMLVLPYGLCYGYLNPQAAIDVAKAHETGHVVPRYLRGRSCHPAPAQAAQHFAREALDETRVDALPLLTSARLDDATWRVVFGTDTAPTVVTIRESRSATPVRLSCTADGTYPRTFELVTVTSG